VVNDAAGIARGDLVRLTYDRDGHTSHVVFFVLSSPVKSVAGTRVLMCLDGDGMIRRVRLTNDMLDAGQVSFLCRSGMGMWYKCEREVPRE
jgi:hypothetical protein